jgi:hypothetical protein
VTGLAQSTLVILGLILFVRIEPAHPFLLLLAGWVTSLVFTLIIYTFVVAFGNAGKLAVLLLVIQISGSAVRIRCSCCRRFQNVSPFLPATHAISAMRSAIAGTYGADFWISIGLLAFLVPTLLLGLVLRRPLVSTGRAPSTRWPRRSSCEGCHGPNHLHRTGRRRDATANRAALLPRRRPCSRATRTPRSTRSRSRRGSRAGRCTATSPIGEPPSRGDRNRRRALQHDRRGHRRPRPAGRASRTWRRNCGARHPPCASANIALDDAHVAQTMRSLAPLRRRVRELTREGVASGAFRGDVPPELLAFLIEETGARPSASCG